jgi:hypothetical protein
MSDDCPVCKGTGKFNLGEMTLAEYLKFRRDAGFQVFLSTNKFLTACIENASEQEGQGRPE